MIEFQNIRKDYEDGTTAVVDFNLVLEDPQGMFLASHVVPIVSDNVNEEAAEIINRVNAALTPEELVKLNDESVNGKRSAADIAHDFLVSAGVIES